jgi:hypothetical protein
MPTFPSPVALSDFQKYIRDGSTDPTILAFYQSLLNTATEKIYTYLDRDYTPGAIKTDVFFGNASHVHRMYHPAGTIITWKSSDFEGNVTVQNIAELVLMANGIIVINAKNRFFWKCEHRINYSLPSTLACPETVMQVITEVAAIIFEESKMGGARLGIEIESNKNDTSGDRARYLDLTPRHIEMLAPYKRVAI